MDYPFDEVDAFNRIPTLLPESDRAEARQLLESVGALHGFVQSFESAIELFDHAQSEFNRVGDDLNAMAPDDKNFFFHKMMSARFGMIAWMRIACRDGAIQMFHLGRIMQVIRETLHRCPSLLQHTSVDRLKIAMKLMNSLFPHWDLIRHSVAHSPQEFMPSAKSRIREGRGPHQIGEMIMNREYIITRDGVRYAVAIDRNSLERLQRVRHEFVSGFADLITRAKTAEPWPRVALPPKDRTGHQS